LVASNVSTTSFPNYFLNLFFVNEYLNNGGNFDIATSLPSTDAKECFVGAVDACHSTLNEQKDLDVSSYNTRLAYVVAAISHLFAPESSLDHDVGSLANATFPGDSSQNQKARAAVQKYIGDSTSNNLQTMGSRMWNAWDNENPTFVTAMQGAINTKSSEIIASSDNGWSRERTESGEKVASFISNFRSNQYFTADPPSVDKRSSEQDLWNSNSQHWYDGGGCFVPGTKVLTSDGQQISIDSIQEGTPILTRADTNEFGWASDERVEISIEGQDVDLFGFNNDDPFFTCNHVFMTTGGHRALHPEGAMRENPYLEVGHLKVGDVVYQCTDGKTYQTITINKITVKKATSTFVYGVHLREGLRSYHANGYLVYLNYPEITLASLGRSILSMPQDEQLKMLLSLYELGPLLERFGGPVVLNAFHKQLAENSEKALPQQLTSNTLLDVDQSYELVSESDKLTNLPLLNVHRGFLQVDSEVCDRYTLLKRCISWSRSVNAGQSWEHGFCKIQDDLAGGAGFFLYSEKFEVTESEWTKATRISCFARSSHATYQADSTNLTPSVQFEGKKTARMAAVDDFLAASSPAPQAVEMNSVTAEDISVPGGLANAGEVVVPDAVQRFNLKSVSQYLWYIYDTDR
jgi:hypothetical protein